MAQEAPEAGSAKAPLQAAKIQASGAYGRVAVPGPHNGWEGYQGWRHYADRNPSPGFVTRAYLEARAVVGPPQTEREAALCAALEEAFASRGEVEAELQEAREDAEEHKSCHSKIADAEEDANRTEGILIAGQDALAKIWQAFDLAQASFADAQKALAAVTPLLGLAVETLWNEEPSTGAKLTADVAEMCEVVP